tara:strand:+ start:1188 stop:1658 length:471 start_codon:yes stop_codon:yes gene_type:complete
MWIVAKINKKNQNLFFNELKKKISDIKIYYPKIFHKKQDRNILGDYVFCYHKKFESNFHFHLNYIKGLKSFLENNQKDQSDIIKFINYCILHEDKNGFLKSSFFKKNITKMGKFINGPFANYLFEVASKEKNKLKIFLGDFNLTVSDENNILYQKI